MIHGITNGITNGHSHTNGLNNGHTNVHTHHNHETNGIANGNDIHATNGIMNGDGHQSTADINNGDAAIPYYEPIALIGCAMRLPGGVETAESLWDLLENKREGRCRVPADRFNVEAFYGPGEAGHVHTEYGHFLQNVDMAKVDSSHWSMTRQELEDMDPQQRLALEVVYECLQSSGTTKWKGKNIGTYFGSYGEVRNSKLSYEAIVRRGEQDLTGINRIGQICLRWTYNRLESTSSQVCSLAALN
jgi:hypothetical protein